MILLDTDMLTILHGPASEKRGRLVDRLEIAGNADEEVVASIISFEEQMRGWLSYISRSNDAARQVPGYDRLHRLIDHYQSIRILDFDEPAALAFQHLRTIYRRHNTLDLKIAAIAQIQDALLLSGNSRDFASIKQVRFEPFGG